MKKQLTYVLLILVFILWGAIFYRLLSDETPETANVAKRIIDSIPVNDTVANYELIADYRDPFFEGKDIVVTTETPLEDNYLPTETLETYTEPVPISYVGIIQNPSNNKQIIILNIEGKDVMFSDGETRQNVTFLKNFDSYVQILYHHKIETIYK